MMLGNRKAMKLPFLIIAAIFCLGSVCVSGQSSRSLLSSAREIRLLESTREDVRRILAEFNPDSYEYHSQEFTNHSGTILISFSDGSCDQSPEEEDETVIWNVGEWRVTRIEIVPNEPFAIKETGLDLSKFKKEQMYSGFPDHHIYHDKARGVAVETDEDEIETIIFFPPIRQAKSLCEGSRKARDFYSRTSWFDKKLKYRSVCILINIPPNVMDLELNPMEIEATTGKTVSVTTTAVDAENDVLTYSYQVSAGRIVGSGANVTWDLTSVKAGTYTITVGVDDGAGIVGRTETKTIIIK